MMIMTKTWNYFSISLNINSFDLKQHGQSSPCLSWKKKNNCGQSVGANNRHCRADSLSSNLLDLFPPPGFPFWQTLSALSLGAHHLLALFGLSSTHEWLPRLSLRRRGERRQFPSASTSPSEIERSRCRVAAETPGFCFLGFIFPLRRRGTK